MEEYHKKKTDEEAPEIKKRQHTSYNVQNVTPHLKVDIRWENI